MDEKKIVGCFVFGGVLVRCLAYPPICYLRSHSIEMKIPCVCLVCKWLFLPSWVGMFLIQMPIWWEYVWTKFFLWRMGLAMVLLNVQVWNFHRFCTLQITGGAQGKQASVARVYDFLVTWPTQKRLNSWWRCSWGKYHEIFCTANELWSFVGWDVKWFANFVGFLRGWNF